MITITKRDGREVEFDKDKIVQAVSKAFTEVYPVLLESDTNGYKPIFTMNGIVDVEYTEVASRIAQTIERDIDIGYVDNHVESIQDEVENLLMDVDHSVAKAYIRYRYKREMARNTIKDLDEEILEIVEGTNEYFNEENSNKNPKIISTQRDYMAGAVSKSLTNRVLLPEDVVEADKQGLIHFHDADYFTQRAYNCCLINLEDMLQNGTVISGVLIEKPHSFSTACTIATQIIAQVASAQYGLKVAAVL